MKKSLITLAISAALFCQVVGATDVTALHQGDELRVAMETKIQKGISITKNSMQVGQIAPSKTPLCGEMDANYIKDILQASKVFQLLAALQEATPEIAHSMESTVTMIELHGINQRLDLIIAELQKNRTDAKTQAINGPGFNN